MPSSSESDPDAATGGATDDTAAELPPELGWLKFESVTREVTTDRLSPSTETDQT